MQAIILCGGQGTRLREHTELRPKPMVEIGGRPILWHIMKLYAHHGITDFILCLGYKGDIIRQYFLDYEAMNCDFTVTLGRKNSIRYHGNTHNENGWSVTLVDTGENSMTGARLRRAAPYIRGKTFALTYGDGVSDVNLKKAAAFHKAHKGLATLTGVRPPSRYGEIEHDGSKVVSFSEKPAVSQGRINGGFFFFETDFLNNLSDGDDCILERAPLEKAAAEGQLHVFEHDGYWQCMDTYRDWLDLDKKWNAGQAPWKVWK
jgi:glucose-1-phosphate cytidylyltransferase